MIVCPDCGIELQEEGPRLECPGCSFCAHRRDGILFFPVENVTGDFEDYKADWLDRLYKYEQDHFWFKNRRRFIRRIFNKYVDKKERILEIGAGTGSVSRMLAENGYCPELGEIHLKGLQYAAQYGLNRLYRFDTRKAPFKEEFDTVCMFDVLEHIEDDGLVLRNIHRMLKKEGKLILTVPAHRFLWSGIDEASGHKRRYELKELKSKLMDNGFDIVDAGHFFTFLLPFLYIRTLLNRKETRPLEDMDTGLRINRLFNLFFNGLSVMEYYLFAGFSPGFGGSIIIVGRKQ